MSLNETIIKSPVIVFLGAGASAPLGKPVMWQFVTRLADEIVSKNRVSIAHLFSVLLSARGDDLESILGDLETFLSLSYVSSFRFHGNEHYDGNRTDAIALRSFIRHSIIREYRTVDTKRTVEVYRPLFDTIFTHLDPASCCLPIFTTNYDLAIETFCNSQPFGEYDLIDGMEDDGRQTIWNPSEFESFRVTPYTVEVDKTSSDLDKMFGDLHKMLGIDRQRPRRIVLFKLHGSVDWMRIASTGKIVRSLPMYDVVDSDEYQNTIIYPAGNKVATAEPYLTGYHYFSRCCEHAKVILAIGYSFRDYDALTSLMRARQVNEDLWLLLLSPNSYEVLKTIPDEKDSLLWARPVYGAFGDTDTEPKYLAEIDEWLGRILLKK